MIMHASKLRVFERGDIDTFMCGKISYFRIHGLYGRKSTCA
jgi:hypothetical protein